MSDTQFKAGNQFWKARSSHGRKPIYDDPKKLADAIEQYFEWSERTPLAEFKIVQDGGKAVRMPLPKMRAMTITACARYCGMTYPTWLDYKANPDFSSIIEEAEDIIRDQKFTGAAAGLLNANIIARDLGLKDASDVNVGGQKDNPIVTVDASKISNDALAELLSARKTDK